MPAPHGISSRDTGETVTDHRSSWVRRIRHEDRDVFVKTYAYESWRERFRNLGRWTAPWRRSRAQREWLALTWLRGHGFEAPEPLACLEWRRCGWLHRATLITAAYPGQAADRALDRAGPEQRRAICAAIRAFTERLHRSGFRDRNLDLRNLLVGGSDDAPVIAKIDSPRYRLVRGHPDDRLARADWQRLLPQLTRYEIDGS